MTVTLSSSCGDGYDDGRDGGDNGSRYLLWCAGGSSCGSLKRMERLGVLLLKYPVVICSHIMSIVLLPGPLHL